jgi:hypothetical protein
MQFLACSSQASLAGCRVEIKQMVVIQPHRETLGQENGESFGLIKQL